MVNFVTDLYAIAFGFYRRRRGDVARINATGMVITTYIFAVLNIIQFFELLANRPRILPSLNRRELWLYGLPVFAVAYLCVSIWVRRHPILHSDERIEEYRSKLSHRRKVAVIAGALTNVGVMVIVAQLRAH